MDNIIRVLHVDDEPDFADLVATFLDSEGEHFEVETALDADEGMEKISQESFDCIVSDYDMPGKNGIEFLEEFREDHPEIPFILYTGKGSEEVAGEAISKGVSDYLQKESGTSQYTVLANRIQNVVEQYRAQLEAAETQETLSLIAEKTDDILFVFDNEWSELHFINSAYEDVWGRDIDELEENPRSFLKNIHPEDRETAEDNLETILSGEPTAVEHRILDQDDEVRWIYGEANPVYNDDGEFHRIVGLVRDMTELRDGGEARISRS